MRLGIETNVIDCILSTYDDAKTTISIHDRVIGDFDIKRGVKQGDPLSPFLFNVVIDEVIEEVNSIPGASGCNCMGYADDLILMHFCVKNNKIALEVCVSALSRRNLSINALKCNAVSVDIVPRQKKCYTITQPQFKMNDSFIPQLTAQSLFKYLGCKYSVYGVSGISVKDIDILLEKLRKAALKPFQKFKILKVFLIPRFIARAQHLQCVCIIRKFILLIIIVNVKLKRPPVKIVFGLLWRFIQWLRRKCLMVLILLVCWIILLLL